MSLSFEDKPHFDKREYQRGYDKKRPVRKWSEKNSRRTTDAAYLRKPIVAIDGEGYNVRRGPHKGEHIYNLLAISDCEPISDINGLSTKAILDYVWKNMKPGTINVIYGGSYDFNMWIKDLTRDEVQRLYNGSYTSEAVTYQGYGLRWIKGKAFEISRTLENGNKRTITVNDVISFFQRPFIQACDEYLGTYEGRKELVREKARRGNFTPSELGKVAHYNNLELRLLVQLVMELRERLNRVGLRPRRWNSPGAIAAALFTDHGIKQYLDHDVPESVARAARFAYAGGRFEMCKYGAVKENVYEYDFNSAYPRALLEVPSLQHGSWHHHKGGYKQWHYALYRVRFSGTNPHIPGPIFHRGDNGTISYPLNVTNWIWSPEFEVLQEYCAQVEGAEYEVLEAWEFRESALIRPFAFFADLYKLRQELKAKGDGAHVGVKLGMNSAYGKLAQQVSWRAATARFPLRVPTYHQLEWAGYVTSWCRAGVLRAALTDIESVIAFETDALFTTRPLDITIGTGLGEWEETIFTDMTYVQSGHYYATESTGKPVIKCRGIDKGYVSRENVEARLLSPVYERVLPAALTRFYGAGIALRRDFPNVWRRWITDEKRLVLMPTGKRMHGNCWCDEHGPLALGFWHNTFCPVYGGESSEYPVEWINPNPSMDELSELRESENYYED